MHSSVRTMLRATSMLSSALVLAACAAAGNDLTGPGGTCPAATLSRGPSRDLVPSGISATAGGCAHRAPIEVPLTRVIDLNDRGEVLGVVNATGPAQLAVWSITGIRLLTTPPGAVDVIGTDLNNNGEAVGCAEFPAPPPPPGGDFDRVANSGTFSETGGTSVCHVIVWNAQGVPTDLGLIDPAAREAKGLAINDAGVIVGTVLTASGQRAFVRSASGAVTYIPTPGTRSAAVALNELGEVTGWYTNGSAQFGPWHGFVWSQAGGTLAFSDLPVSNAESSMLPVAINESGDVVGSVYSYRATSPTTLDRSRTFLHSRAEGVGVQDLGFAFLSVASINDEGEILGFANPDGALQPYTWSRSRPDWLAVRFDVQPSPGNGTVLTVNNWNEVLDSYLQAGANHNVVWTWNPERYR